MCESRGRLKKVSQGNYLITRTPFPFSPLPPPFCLSVDRPKLAPTVDPQGFFFLSEGLKQSRIQEREGIRKPLELESKPEFRSSAGCWERDLSLDQLKTYVSSSLRRTE